MLATCETNIVCVKNVCRHLTQEDIGINDVQRVQGELTGTEVLTATESVSVFIYSRLQDR